MYLYDLYRTQNLVISFEIFPPKKEYNVEKLYQTGKDLKQLNPGFVSVTYGAGGGTRDKTIEIASKIKNEINLEAVAHYTCVNTTVSEIDTLLDELKRNNIHNILALRGDPPKGEKNFTKTIGGYEYAYELIQHIKKHGDWSIAVAGYPEGHIECRDLNKNIEYLKMKVDAGADVILTQLFFNNHDFYHFRDLAVQNGIHVPIIPGVFPIINYKTIGKVSSLCGARIPDSLLQKLEENKDNPEEIEKIGIEYAIKQSEDLIKNEIQGLHYYSMNKSKQIIEIVESLDLIKV